MIKISHWTRIPHWYVIQCAVWPWSRQWHDLWLCKPFGLDIAALDGSISLKFSWETWLEPKSFEPLINFLACLVQKLWFKNNKSINYPISGL